MNCAYCEDEIQDKDPVFKLSKEIFVGTLSEYKQVVMPNHYHQMCLLDILYNIVIEK